jgi:membrane protein implicated in regulation of membrane protease activity
MKSKTYFTAKGFWFVMEVILIFISVEAIAYAVGHFDAGTIALVLLGVIALLFLAALFSSRRKDKKRKNGFAV